MEVIKTNNFVMVGYQWRVESVTNNVVNKVSCRLYLDGWQILFVKTSLSLIFDFGAVYGWVVGFSIVVSGSNFAD